MGENKVKDKHGKVIQEGDSVATKYRGGTRQGEVILKLATVPCCIINTNLPFFAGR
jgi:hypothetical protein